MFRSSLYRYATIYIDGGVLLEEIQQAYLYMLKVERHFSEHTLKSYHDDLEQFNDF